MGKGVTRFDGDHEPARGEMPLARTRWAIVGALVGVLGSSWVGVGHRGPKPPNAPPDAVGAPDGAIDRAVLSVSRGVDDASTTVQHHVDRAREASRKSALVSQVKSRLAQDKGLDAGKIVVAVEEEGTVKLEGQVPDADSKEMAVDLVREVRGVARVVDSLAVPPARPRVVEADPIEAPATATTTRTRRYR